MGASQTETAGRIVLGIAAAAIIIGGGAALLTKEDDSGTVSVETSTSRPVRTTVAGSPIPPSPGEAYKIGGFGNSWLAGIYEAPGGPGCSWVVQRDLVGDESSILREGSEPRVGLRDGEYFTSEGCGTWRRVGRI